MSFTQHTVIVVLYQVLLSLRRKTITSRTKVVTITVQTLPSILTLCRLTFSSNCSMHSAGWTRSPSGVPQKAKDSSTSCHKQTVDSMNQVALESYASNSEITETKYINISRKHKQQNIQSQVQSVSEKNLTTMDDATF